MKIQSYKTLDEAAAELELAGPLAVLDLIVDGHLEVCAYRNDDFGFQVINSLGVKRARLRETRVPLMFHRGDSEDDSSLPTTSLDQLRISAVELDRYKQVLSPFIKGFSIDRDKGTVTVDSTTLAVSEKRFSVVRVMVDAAKQWVFELSEQDIRKKAKLDKATSVPQLFRTTGNKFTPEWKLLFEKTHGGRYRLKVLKPRK